MRTTCVLNLKGGVGKTTTVIHLGAITAQIAQKRVLVIDADSQCNLTDFFGADSSRGNLAQILRGEAAASGCIQQTKVSGLDILPASDELMELDLSAISGHKCRINAIREIVADAAALDQYDYILVDCPPAFNAAAAAALVAADDVLIPIKLDAFSLMGMANISRQIRNMQKINPRLHVAGFLPTMWYRNAQIVEAEHQLKQRGLRVFHHIRRSPKVDELTFSGAVLDSRNSASEIDYRAFAAEYMGGVKNGL